MSNPNTKQQNNKNSNNEKIAETHQLAGNKSIYSDAEIMNTATSEVYNQDYNEKNFEDFENINTSQEIKQHKDEVISETVVDAENVNDLDINSKDQHKIKASELHYQKQNLDLQVLHKTITYKKTHQSRSEYLVTFGGSQQFGDYMDDIGLAIGVVPKQFHDAWDKVVNIIKKANEHHIDITFNGHSLGGSGTDWLTNQALDYIRKRKYNIKINGLAINPAIQPLGVPTNNDSRITNIITDKDPLNFFETLFPDTLIPGLKRYVHQNTLNIDIQKSHMADGLLAKQLNGQKFNFKNLTTAQIAKKRFWDSFYLRNFFLGIQNIILVEDADLISKFSPKVLQKTIQNIFQTATSFISQNLHNIGNFLQTNWNKITKQIKSFVSEQISNLGKSINHMSQNVVNATNQSVSFMISEIRGLYRIFDEIENNICFGVMNTCSNILWLKEELFEETYQIIMNSVEQLFGVAEVIELLGRKAPLLMEDIITLNWYKIGIHVQEALQEYKYEMKQHYLTTKMGYDHFLVQEISNDMGRLNQEIQEFKYEIEHALQEVERLDQKIAQGFNDGIN